MSDHYTYRVTWSPEDSLLNAVPQTTKRQPT